MTEKKRPPRKNNLSTGKRPSSQGPGSARPAAKQKPEGPELIRLNKYIANAGICSRREADKLIQSGVIEVNGKIVKDLGTKVSKDDVVKFDNRRLKSEKKYYVLLNKPKGYITTTDDPFERKTVMTLISSACSERIYPVGRLDRDTTGLLMFTNDGELAKKLTHPRHNVRKIYHAVLDKPITKTDMKKIADGLTLEDGPVNVDKIAYVSDSTTRKELGIELHSGRNRIVRRIFESLGYKVLKLDRVLFAGLTKKDIPRGTWRYLTEKEVSYLKML